MASLNPNSPRQIERLRAAMKWSSDQLRPFRNTYLHSLKQYVGKHYGSGATEEKVPLNMLKLTVDVYQRQLSAKPPRILCLTNDQHLRTDAYELEIATNHLINEILLGETLQAAVKNALFMIGIVKVGITPTVLGEAEGYRHDAGQPFADSILFDDWLHDMTARRQEEWDWCGNRYRLPRDLVMESPMYDQAAKEGLEGEEADDIDNVGHAKDLSHSTGPKGENYIDYIDLWDIWLPRDGLLITIAERGEDKPLRIVEWDGPESGPYHLLKFYNVPGNVMPSAPIQHLIDMHEMLNTIFLKLGRQAERQKTITFADGTAASDGTADRIAKSEDGEVVRVDSPNAIKEARYGGIDQANMAFFLALKEQLSYAAGNLNVLGGLSQEAATATQEKLLHGSSSQLIQDMQDKVSSFAKGIVTDLAHYLYHDPMIELPLVKRVKGTDIVTSFTWGPEQREGDFFQYNFQVEPYSMQSRGPGERLGAIMQLATQFILPAMPMLQQSGGEFDFEEFISLISKYSDLPELANLIRFGGVPVAPGGAPQQVERMRQSPVTSRNYNRVSSSTGGTQQSRDNVMMQTLLSGSSQVTPQQTAMMGR